MATYLNVAIKDGIKNAASRHVNKRFSNSASGKELKSMSKQIEKKIRALWEKRFPPKEMKILIKHGVSNTQNSVRFVADADGDIRVNPFRVKKPAIICFDPPLCYPHQKFETNVFTKDKACRDAMQIYYKIHDANECEIKEVISAYASRVNKFRTVERLLAEYPDMAKFVSLESEPASTGHADELIHEFEKD